MKKVPENELTFSFSKSSGPGGQNVNKLNTKVTMKWAINESRMYSKAHLERFRENYPRYIYQGIVIIKSERYRSQLKNINDCKQKLYDLLLSVRRAPSLRKKTKPSKKAVQKRLDDKKKRSIKKRLRREDY